MTRVVRHDVLLAVVLLIFCTPHFGDGVRNQCVSTLVFIRQPSDMVVKSGQAFMLECSPGLVSTGSSCPDNDAPKRVASDIAWSRNGQALVGRSLRTLENGSLLVGEESWENVDMSGVYSCLIKVKHETLISRNATVSLASLPRPHGLPSLTLVLLGSYHRYSCGEFESAVPHPVVTWYKINNEFRNSSMLSPVLPNGVLEIQNVSSDDQGVYYCGVSNLAGNFTSNLAMLKLTDRLIPSKTSRVSKPSNISLLIGADAFFDCSGFGVSPVTWFHLDKRMKFEDGRLVQLTSGGLYIRQTISSDAGSYMCLVQDGNRDITITYFLTIRSPPVFNPCPAAVYTTSIGKILTVECGARGASTSWYLHGVRVKNDETHRVWENGTMQLIGVTPSSNTTYQCFATNRDGCEQTSSRIFVDGESSNKLIPNKACDAAYDVQIVEYSATYLTLTWMASHKVHLFKVRIVSAGGDERTESTTRDKLTINQMSAGETYQVSVASTCPIFSRPLNITLPTHDQLPPPIRDLSARSLAPGKIYVTWHPQVLQSSSGAYKLVKIDDDGRREELDVVGVTHQFVGLDLRSRYQFQVARKTRSGMVGHFSELANVSACGTCHPDNAPTTAPTNIVVTSVDSSSLLLRWQLPSDASIKGHKIRVKERLTQIKYTVDVPGNQVSRYRLTALTPDTEYVIRMMAYNDAGLGPLSRKVTTTTLLSHHSRIRPLKPSGNIRRATTPPGRPSLVAVRAFSHEILVSWSADKLAAATEFVVKWGAKSPQEHEVSLRGGTNQYRIGNLRPETLYYISVRAGNEAGVGAEELRTAVTKPNHLQPPAELYPPLGVRITVLTSTTLNVSWHDIDRRQRDFYYTIRYKTNAPVERRTRYVNSTLRNCLLHGLRAHTYYEVAVRVQEGSRRSDWSMVASKITLESKPGSAPADLTVMAMPDDPTVVNLNWQPPEKPNGKLNGYLVFYTTDSQNDISKWVIEPVMGDGLSTTIEGLTADTHYYFKVLARNTQGVGPYSAVIQYTTPKRADGAGPVPDASTRNWLLYMVIGGVALLVMCIVVIATIVVCCNKRSGLTFDRKKQKYKAPESGARRPIAANLYESSSVEPTPLRAPTVASQRCDDSMRNGFSPPSVADAWPGANKPYGAMSEHLDNYIDLMSEPSSYNGMVRLAPMSSPPGAADTASFCLSNGKLPMMQGYGGAPYLAHYPYPATQPHDYNGAGGDSAYSSDFPQHRAASRASTHTSSSGGCKQSNRRSVGRRPVAGCRGRSSDSIDTDELNAELAGVVEFVHDMKSHHDNDDGL